MDTDKKMIIIEGCDGSGKSTLARKISEDLGLPIAQRIVTSEGGPPSGADLRKWLWRELADPTPKIYDRFPIFSDPIYSKAMNREQNIGPHTIKYFIDNFEPMVILCDPGLSAVRENVLNEAQMPGVVENLTTIYSQYRFIHPLDFIYDHGEQGSLGYEFLSELIQDYLEI